MPFAAFPSIIFPTFINDEIPFNILSPMTLMDDGNVHATWGCALTVPHTAAGQAQLTITASDQNNVVLLKVDVSKWMAGLSRDEIPEVI